MMLCRYSRFAVASGGLLVLLSSCGLKRHPYDNPIANKSQQPDKILFDKAVNDIEHSRYEIARLTLNTLINTYDSSEYLAKAKLAIADSWFREGGAHGLAEAEADYKDFILFYPQMEEAAEAQMKICDIHYKEMDKPDRDTTQARRAEDECRQLIVTFPNSKFVPQAQQRLRSIQEDLADADFLVGMMYHKKGSFPAAANRLQGVADQYPLFSQADEALWNAADAYRQMGDRFEDREAGDYTEIVKDYPLSTHVEEAKSRLEAMKRPVPEADPGALARMQYELKNRPKASLTSRIVGPLSGHPDLRAAATSGAPNMEGFKPTIPLSVPGAEGAAGTTGVGITGVSAQVVNDPNAPGKNGDQAAPSKTATPAASGLTAQAGATQNANLAALPQNHVVKQKKPKQRKTKQQKPAAATTPASATPAATTPNAAPPPPTTPPQP
jgi:outer membrane protein assembly factor BamD